MLLASLIFSGRDWLVPVVALAGVGVAALAWGYARAQADRGLRAVCVMFKVTGFAALALCLLEPMWTGQRAKPGANMLAVVADNSQGMQIHDRGNAQSRADFLRESLVGKSGDWLAKLREDFEVRGYVFDSRVQPTTDFSELTFDGRASAIGTTLKTLKERFANRPLAGVVLLTDGNATDIAGELPDLKGLPPIYPVVIGREDTDRDIALANVAVTQTSFEDAPVTIQAEATASGYVGSDVTAELLDRDGKKVDQQTLRVKRDGETLAFRFQLKPEKKGVSFYRVRVGAQGEGAQFKDAKTSLEATLANNTRVVTVDRGRGPFRILYVSGRPNWEFKFLNRALAEDDQVELVGLIRIAKREPKFDFRGRAGESSNPLFRGFGNQSKEEIQRYDQPVLVRLNTKDADELSKGFPSTPEELFAYHAVIVDDMEAEFFTADQKALLQKFVSERGGGFLMLGGAESFHEGGYLRTPIGDMLPVYLDRAPAESAQDGLRLGFTREGWLQSWARLRPTENEEKTRLAAMPAFQVANEVRDLKPGASGIATITGGAGQPHPAVAVQRFGHGRTAVLTVGDLWRWGMLDAENHADMDKAWRQLTRWLVADVPNRVELTAQPRKDDANQAVELGVRVRDPKHLPLDNATVFLNVQPVLGGVSNGPALRLPAEASTREPGLYTATYIPRETGGYHVEAVATNTTGMDAGRAVAGWTTDLAAEEFKSLKPNRALLERIAKETGGEVVDMGALGGFAARLPHLKSPVTEAWTMPLWHQPAVFLFALLCFLAEWGLRRRRGLP
ncbi:MAG: glutamine amidotransferase [Limisphaerales bacterium]